MNITDKIQVLRKDIDSLVRERDTIIRGQNLDEKFCLPDGNWRPDAANDYRHKYELLRDSEDPANTIRLLTEEYTGERPEAQFQIINRQIVQSWRIINGIDEQPVPYLYRPLPISGERGPMIDGVIVNQDTFTYQNYINLMIPTIDRLRQIRRPVIIEIGAGYGALALALHQALGDNTLYVICDLPEALMFSGVYLTLAMKHTTVVSNDNDIGLKTGIMLLPNYLFHTLKSLNGSVDLVVNTLSMSEMSEYQVSVYAEGIAKLIGKRGVFFEHNHDNQHLPGMINCKEHIEKYFLHSQVENGGLCHFRSNP